MNLKKEVLIMVKMTKTVNCNIQLTCIAWIGTVTLNLKKGLLIMVK